MLRWIGAGVLTGVATLGAVGQITTPPLPGEPVVLRPPQRVPGAPPPAKTEPPPSAIVGQVVDSQSGRPVPRAIVRLASPAGTIVQTRVADDRGRFYFKGVMPGEFSIAAERSGYFRSVLGQRRAHGEGTPITIGTNGIVGQLRLDMFRPSVIAGAVFDEAAEPLVGVAVHALRRRFVDGAWRLEDIAIDETDDRGNYRLVDLIPGDYIIAVPAVKVTMPNTAADASPTSDVAERRDLLMKAFSPAPQNGAIAANASATSGSVAIADSDQRNSLIIGSGPSSPPRDGSRIVTYANTYYVGADLMRLAMPITIGPGETRGAVTLHLRPVPTSRVSGRLLGDGNVGAPYRPLRLLVDGDDDLGFGTEIAATLSGADGSFTFLDVPQGRYIIEARATWPTSATQWLIFGDFGTPSPSGWTRQPVTVNDEDVSGLAVSLSSPAALVGSVVYDTQQPAPPGSGSMVVSLAPAGPAMFALPAVTPNADRRFQLTSLPQGTYVLRVRGIPNGWSLKSAMLNGIDVADSPFTLHGGAVPEVTLTLTDRITRTIGTVRDFRGQVQATAAVLVFPADRRDVTTAGLPERRLREARVSASGVFRIDGLPAGAYVFVAIDDADADGWQDEARLSKLAPLGTRVTLVSGESRTVDLRQVTVRK